MKPRRAGEGFTLVELLITIVIIAILAAISIVSYNGIVKMTVQSALSQTLKQAATATNLESVQSSTVLSDLPEQVRSKSSDDITLKFVPMDGTSYGELSAVQNGVLFYNTCLDLISDSYYSTIHARSGGDTDTVMMSCDPGGTSIAANRILISGWDSQSWGTPITRQQIQDYIDNVAYDDWWIDRQAVVQDFYTELADRFESQGGTWPITSFWDHWANQWAGVYKEELPEPSVGSEGEYCIMATHKRYPEMPYSITNTDSAPHEGGC